ncbi:plant self-incompatibility protein S1 family [Artemisia annua]|uniref:S-protein homolog n=1 Tax=Artemisia annua TaxID=35608 RepID=A0A2U1KM52_ARTAN|nr:plant self-incompatibility protein S1 family [Artemisia annua]
MFNLMILIWGNDAFSKVEKLKRINFWNVYEVYIKDGDVDNLMAHCKSGDDDLGDKELTPNQYFHWRFRQNVFLTTIFFCTFRWMAPDDRTKLKNLYTVFVMDGEIDNLKAHCRSGDDDIGEKSLTVPQYFHWTFRMNIIGSTRFICNFRWMADENTVLKDKTFDVFNIRIMYRCGERFDVNNCYWLVRKDGFYFAKDDKPFPDGWQLLFNWD